VAGSFAGAIGHTGRVSDGKWFEGWVPWSELAGFAAAGRALLPSVPATPAAVLRTAGEQLVGRRLTAHAGENEIDLTLTELDYETDSLRLATGRLGDVRIVAEDVTWPETPLKRLTVVGRDVRLRSLPTPAVIPASVEIEIAVSAEVLRERIAELRPRVLAEPAEDGMLNVRWARRPRWGYAQLEPSVDSSGIRLRPRALRVAGRRFPLPIKSATLPLPELPPGLRLIEVEPRAGELVLRTLAEQWPERLSSIPLPELVGWLTTAALTMSIPRLAPRRRA
jgi:hypothetical protein